VGRTLSLGMVLAILWLALSGHFEPLLLAFGGGSVLLVTWLAVRMEVSDPEGHPIHLALRGLRYWPWLLQQMLVSSLSVIRIILDPRLPISPRLIQVQPSQHTDLGRVIFANSITLTPGTVSVRVSEEGVLVHSLTERGARALAAGHMDRRVSRLEHGG